MVGLLKNRGDPKGIPSYVDRYTNKLSNYAANVSKKMTTLSQSAEPSFDLILTL